MFNQTIVSCDLIKSDEEFVRKANQKVKEISNDISYLIDTSKEYEIVIAIICNDIDRPNIPFFSKITFALLKRRLKTLKYKLSIKSIVKDK